MTNPRIALVTGATAGLGRAVAGTLAKHGMHVLVHGRNARRAADEITESGGTAEALLAGTWSERPPTPPYWRAPR
jgi:NAD(P)-dependent dehydrogenase (short-subunit alcohol dehydrogenase family)